LLGAVASLFTGISEKLISAKPAPAAIPTAQVSVSPSAAEVPVAPTIPTLSQIKAKYQNRIPKLWGETVPGVLKRIKTEKKIVFLTFDACGGHGGNQYDRPLLDFLRHNQVKATLFLNSRWIEANPEVFQQLAADQLFSIQNHGTKHCPLSVNGKSIYKIPGTDSVTAVYQEIMGNDAKIKALTGTRPCLFRSGTAYYDEVSAQIAQALGYTLCGFDILGDAGATYSRAQIIKAAQAVKPGSIIIYHMNQPQSSTCAGVKAVVAQLRSQGYQFGKLVDYPVRKF
jgi:peptidoglycan/xylan/chitin deacetylase (PgdA/CDA1 family)